MNRIAYLIERIGALQRSEMRRYAAELGLQMVHLEVMMYLQNCNRYSDTTQGLSEFLGQTKGSISQTIGFLEGEGYLRRAQDLSDKRVFHLELLPKSRRIVQKFEEQFYGDFAAEKISEKSLEEALVKVQKRNGLKSFGLCSTCRFNSNPSGNKFICGLTGQSLSNTEIHLYCREHTTHAVNHDSAMS